MNKRTWSGEVYWFPRCLVGLWVVLWCMAITALSQDVAAGCRQVGIWNKFSVCDPEPVPGSSPTEPRGSIETPVAPKHPVESLFDDSMAAKNQGNLPKAIELLEKAVIDLEELGYPKELHQKILAELSALYVRLGDKTAKRDDHENARDYYSKAYKWAWLLNANFNEGRWLSKAKKLWDKENDIIKARAVTARIDKAKEVSTQMALEEQYKAELEEVSKKNIHGRIDKFVGNLQKQTATNGGTAIQQLKNAERQGRLANLDTSLWGELGKSSSNIPFDEGSPVISDDEDAKVPSIRSAGPVAIAIVMQTLDRKVKALDRKIGQEKNPEKKAELLEVQIYTLTEQSKFLKESIKKEEDPVKRSQLINKQTFVKSKMRTHEIELIDLPVRPPK